jgi:predicted Zn-ribbon and HTH transcriptional regulator
MQPTTVKHYGFHFEVKRVHYKDRCPNGSKLAIVMLYFGVPSLLRVGL